MVRVLFVCLGNICRSPTAHGVMQRLLDEHGLAARIEVDSAGTHGYHVGEPPDERARQAAAYRKIDLSSLRARVFSEDDFDRFDYILAMDEANLEHLQALRPSAWRGHLGLLTEFTPRAGVRAVPDPYYGGEQGFDRVLDLVEEAAQGLLDHLRNHHL